MINIKAKKQKMAWAFINRLAKKDHDLVFNQNKFLDSLFLNKEVYDFLQSQVIQDSASDPVLNLDNKVFHSFSNRCKVILTEQNSHFVDNKGESFYV